MGEMYIFEKHVCFDLKVFAFHKQLVVESHTIQALLKTDDKEAEAASVASLLAGVQVCLPNRKPECSNVLLAVLHFHDLGLDPLPLLDVLPRLLEPA